MFQVKEVSQMAGVSVRTLHYYDQIGLLSPAKGANGYRCYSDKEIDRLQTILFYRYLGFELAQIQEILDHGQEQKIDHLIQQAELLRREQARLEQMIQTIDQTIKAEKEGIEMSHTDKFKGFKFDGQDPYEEEAVAKYGREVIEASKAKQEGRETEIGVQFNEVFSEFNRLLKAGVPEDSQQTKDNASKLFNLIREFSFDCSLEVFAMIGQGYVDDVRFTDNIDQFGQGTAAYANQAIQAFVAEEQNQ